MGTAENKKVVLGFVEALSSGNIEAAKAALADDATWWIPGSLPVSGTHRGKKAIFEEFLGKAQALFNPTVSPSRCATPSPRGTAWQWSGSPAARAPKASPMRTIIN